MQTQEIPREQWPRFFDDFSRQHQGWIVNLELLGSEIGDQEEASGLPLVGISADSKDGENRLVIIIGGSPDADVTRIINAPQRVWVKPPRMPGDEAVEVESKDGVTTLLTFQRIPPERTERQLPGEKRTRA